MWIINFFKIIFGKKKKLSNSKTNNDNIEKLSNSKHNSFYNNSTLPSYMMISEEDKLILLNSIQNIKKILKDDNAKQKEISKIIALINNSNIDSHSIKEYLDKQDFDKLSNKRLDTLLNSLDSKVKKDVYSIIDNYNNNVKTIKGTIDTLDGMIEYVKKNNISFETNSLIKEKVSNISFNSDDNNKTILLDKDIINTIKNWDKNIIAEVELEYQKVNYVTISTVMIDRIITEYQKIEDDYKHHRFNKLYYDKELTKIKEQIDFLKKIKNSSKVYNEIEKLRKELYTKSKDKYDILYNNEVFMNINKKCDELLNRVNQKVIDIKKEKKNNDAKRDNIKEEYLKKIILRFKDLNLSCDLILEHREKENEILDYSDISMYLNKVYLEFIEGVSANFNYQRNKTKTELVKLYNDLNNIMAYKKKEKYISINHINFKMEDLVEAIIIRKKDVENEINYSKKLPNSDLVDEKILEIKEKFIQNDHNKVLKKAN